MTPRYFRVGRKDHAYLTFIMESYEGLATVSTVDVAAGIIRILPAEGRAGELEGLLEALRREMDMEERGSEIVPVFR